MPFDRPTPELLRDRLAAELEAALPGADARTRRSVEGVLARMLAIASHGLHGHIQWTADQVLPDTAESEYLDRHAGVWGLARKAASAAAGSVTFTGLAGSVVPAGTELRRADDARYLTEADVTLAGGSGTVAVVATTPGAAANLMAGAKLALLSPVAGVQAQATVAAGGLSGGTEVESDAELRARLLARIQDPPHGGAPFDYVNWALEVPGVTRAWVRPQYNGAGTVGVTFVMDNKAGTFIPGPADVAAVQAHIDQVRPVTAALTVFAPATLAINLSVTLVPDSADVRAAVEAELDDFFRTEGAPGETVYLSRLREAISRGAGEFAHALSAPATDVALAPNQIPVLGTITWGA